MANEIDLYRDLEDIEISIKELKSWIKHDKKLPLNKNVGRKYLKELQQARRETIKIIKTNYPELALGK